MYEKKDFGCKTLENKRLTIPSRHNKSESTSFLCITPRIQICNCLLMLSLLKKHLTLQR